MVVGEHPHQRGAAAAALHHDAAHGVPRLHERDGTGRLAAGAALDIGAAFAQTAEVTAHAAAVLADHGGVAHRVEDALDAVGNVDHETREELLIVRLAVVKAAVVRQLHLVGRAVDQLRQFRHASHARAGSEKAGRVEDEASLHEIGKKIFFQPADPFDLVGPAVQALGRANDARDAARELLETALLAQPARLRVVTVGEIALLQKPARVLRLSRHQRIFKQPHIQRIPKALFHRFIHGQVSRSVEFLKVNSLFGSFTKRQNHSTSSRQKMPLEIVLPYPQKALNTQRRKNPGLCPKETETGNSSIFICAHSVPFLFLSSGVWRSNAEYSTTEKIFALPPAVRNSLGMSPRAVPKH